MTGNLLLDTNLVIALFAGDAGALALIGGVPEVFIPTTVIGELYFGARKSGRIDRNIARVSSFAAMNKLLPCDERTAFEYGIIKDVLRRNGTPIPENDVWIAVVAIQYDLVLGTRDAHFAAVQRLRIAGW